MSFAMERRASSFHLCGVDSLLRREQVVKSDRGNTSAPMVDSSVCVCVCVMSRPRPSTHSRHDERYGMCVMQWSLITDWLGNSGEGKERCTSDSSGASMHQQSPSSRSNQATARLAVTPSGVHRTLLHKQPSTLQTRPHALRLFQPQSDDHRPVQNMKKVDLRNWWSAAPCPALPAQRLL